MTQTISGPNMTRIITISMANTAALSRLSHNGSSSEVVFTGGVPSKVMSVGFDTTGITVSVSPVENVTSIISKSRLTV